VYQLKQYRTCTCTPIRYPPSIHPLRVNQVLYVARARPILLYMVYVRPKRQLGSRLSFHNDSICSQKDKNSLATYEHLEGNRRGSFGDVSLPSSIERQKENTKI